MGVAGVDLVLELGGLPMGAAGVDLVLELEVLAAELPGVGVDLVLELGGLPMERSVKFSHFVLQLRAQVLELVGIPAAFGAGAARAQVLLHPVTSPQASLIIGATTNTAYSVWIEAFTIRTNTDFYLAVGT